ncbi:MAG: hypothetical protein LAO51_04975 [Acidobacteriia bacterium]|nr:hypothetical protein [Terriglobia bacterium]
MSRKAVVAALCVTSALLLTVLLPVGTAVSQQGNQGIRQVIVTNFPDLQKVEGEVTIRGPIRQASQVVLKDVVVPPVGPKDTQRLIQAGTVSVDGFSQIVLSLEGQIKGEVVRPGTVGAILLPEEDAIVRAFEEKGEMQFPLEVTAPTAPGGSPYFASSQPVLRVGFPRYRVLLYNTSAKTVSVTLYAYLTS